MRRDRVFGQNSDRTRFHESLRLLRDSIEESQTLIANMFRVIRRGRDDRDRHHEEGTFEVRVDIISFVGTLGNIPVR